MGSRILPALPNQQPHYSRQFSGIGSSSLLSHNPLTFSAGAGVHHPHRSKGGCIRTYKRPGGVTWTVLQTRLDVMARMTGFPPSHNPHPGELKPWGPGLLSARCITSCFFLEKCLLLVRLSLISRTNEPNQPHLSAWGNTDHSQGPLFSLTQDKAPLTPHLAIGKMLWAQVKGPETTETEASSRGGGT